MKYINEVYIESFKGIEKLLIDNLADINIFVGDNNTYKTSVLEAIKLCESPDNIMSIMRLLRKRETNKIPFSSLSMMDSFLGMFNASQDYRKRVFIEYKINNIKHSLEIMGEVDDLYLTEIDFEGMDYNNIIINQIDEDTPINEFRGFLAFDGYAQDISFNEFDKLSKFRTQRNQNDLLKINYISSSDHLNEKISKNILTEAIKNDEKSKLLEILKIFDKNIDGIEMLPQKHTRGVVTYIRHSEFGFMPLSSFGDGVKKVLTLALGLLSIEGGVLLIDEIENAIHTSALDSVFKWLIEASKMLRIQIIATTHSDEALSSILLNYGEINIDMCVYRLEKFEGELMSRRFSGEKAYNIIINNGGDLR